MHTFTKRAFKTHELVKQKGPSNDNNNINSNNNMDKNIKHSHYHHHATIAKASVRSKNTFSAIPCKPYIWSMHGIGMIGATLPTFRLPHSCASTFTHTIRRTHRHITGSHACNTNEHKVNPVCGSLGSLAKCGRFFPPFCLFCLYSSQRTFV